MFIHCSKNLHIKEGAEELSLKNGFIGEIDDRWAKHWFIQSALSDGTIESPDAGKSAKSKAAKGGKKQETVEAEPASDGSAEQIEDPAEGDKTE